MTENLTETKLRAALADAVADVSEFRGDITITIKRELIAAVCQFLRDDAALSYDFLVDLTAVDYSEHPQKQERFVVTYLLHSYKNNERIRLRVWAPDGDPVVPSCAGVWKAANWMEREVYDLMGVSFSGHPKMERIILPVEFNGHPLRKDFPVEGKVNPIVRVKGFRENFER